MLLYEILHTTVQQNLTSAFDPSFDTAVESAQRLISRCGARPVVKTTRLMDLLHVHVFSGRKKLEYSEENMQVQGGHANSTEGTNQTRDRTRKPSQCKA